MIKHYDPNIRFSYKYLDLSMIKDSNVLLTWGKSATNLLDFRYFN